MMEKILQQRMDLHKKTGILSKTEQRLHNCVSTDLDVAINRKLPSNYIKQKKQKLDFIIRIPFLIIGKSGISKNPLPNHWKIRNINQRFAIRKLLTTTHGKGKYYKLKIEITDKFQHLASMKYNTKTC